MDYVLFNITLMVNEMFTQHSVNDLYIGKKKSLGRQKNKSTEIPITEQKREVEGQCQYSSSYWTSSGLFSDYTNDSTYLEISDSFCAAKVAHK